MIIAKSRQTLNLTILSLAWPTILEQVFQTLVQYVDSAMVGRIGAEASATVGVTGTATWLLTGFSFAAGVGFLACISRAIGAGDFVLARRVSAQSIVFSLLLGTVSGGLGILISGSLPGWMGADPALHRDAAIYFAIVSAALVVRSPMIVFSSVLRAAGDMRTPMLVNVTANVVNVLFNFLLIYETRTIQILGRSITIWGAGMGVAGAALGTAISFVAGFLLMLPVLYRNPAISPKEFPLLPNRAILHQVIGIAIPSALQRLVLCLGQMVFTAQVTSLGTVPLAAHSIAITAEQAFYMPGSGYQAAATTLCGQALGAGDKERIRKIARRCALLSVGTLAATGLLLFTFPGAVMSIFTPDPAVIALGAAVLRLVSVSEPFFGLTMVLEGVFNGIGDTRPGFYISMVSMWGFRILPTLLCVRVFGLGLTAVWCCMVADVIGRSLLLAIRFLKGRWLQRL